MDANRQRFWMLADEDDWQGEGAPAEVEYDACCRRLRLRDRRPDRRAAEDSSPLADDALQRLLRQPSRAVDRFGTLAFWNATDRCVQAVGGVSQNNAPLTLWAAPQNVEVADLTVGFDDVLYLALQETDAGGTVVRSSIGMFDPRGRWRNPVVFEISLDAFTPDRLAAKPGGGVWVLDRQQRRFGCVAGLPLRDGLPPDFDPTTFRPEPENPDPPRFVLETRRQPAWLAQGDPEEPVAIACSPEGRLALITWHGPADEWRETWLHVRDAADGWRVPKELQDAGAATSVAWYSAKQIVVLPAPRDVHGRTVQPREALAYDPDDNTTPLEAAGGFLPVFDLSEGLFLRGVALPPQYPVTNGRRSVLYPLSVKSFATNGTAIGRVLDGGEDRVVWHRCFLEAVFPPACGAIVELAASDELEPPDDEDEWHVHCYGDAPADGLLAPGNGSRSVRGVWWPNLSEVPHSVGLLGVAPERDRAGLFCALVQRRGRRVSRLAGRYLHVRVKLFGPGHRTPEIAALRVYGSRFSYRDEYLAELYREDLFGADADAAGPSTPADFLERFLGLFESMLTPLEDCVAAAHVLTDPRSTPDEALEWLGSWIGVVLDPSFPPARRRAWLQAAPRLFQTRGTRVGLQLALEIATGGRLTRAYAEDPDLGLNREFEFPTGGRVTGGEVIVIEDFRLRRLMATILGADLSLANDPLLPGLIVSANSYVGDTLFIGEEQRAELLALFRAGFSNDPGTRRQEVDAVQEFYGRLAHRATVFVHDEIEPVDFGLLQQVASRQAPAHVAVRVVRATYPLLVGLASLVEVDTYLGPRPPVGVVQLNRTRVGEGDFILRQPALDPRLSGTRWSPALPVARIDGPSTVERGDPLTLQGNRSSAAPGHRIERYLWVRKPPS